MTRDEFAGHAENVAIGESEGLVPLLAWVSSDEDWDRYETLQWRAAARYAAANPDDPDVPDLLERVAHARHEYLAWGRDTLGWALYLFGRPADVAGMRQPTWRGLPGSASGGSGRHGAGFSVACSRQRCA